MSILSAETLQELISKTSFQFYFELSEQESSSYLLE